jgi:hypothetical protein
MSALNDKINSYSVERAVSFEEAYVNPPTQTGSITPTTTAISLTGTAPVYSSSGPLGGDGCWSLSTAATRLRTNSSAWKTSNIDDADYSTGIWFKIATLSNASTSAATSTIFGFTPGDTTEGFSVRVSGGSFSGTPHTLNVLCGSATPLFIGSQLSADTWYYVAIRKSSSSSDTEIYLNGSYVATMQNTSTTNPTYLQFGNTISSGGVVSISNFYYSTYSAINATAISEIWTAGSTSGATNITINETPATASALQTEPTIAITYGDHTEVTTSITVDAELPSNISVSASANINFVDGIMEANAEIGDNITAGGENSTSFDAAEMTASADIVEGIVSRPPMTAVAVMLQPTVYVDPSYYAMVKGLDPLVYFEFDNTNNVLVNKGNIALQNTSIGADIDRSNASGGSMGLVGTGNSWRTTDSTSAAEHSITFEGPTVQSGFNYWNNLEKSRNLTYEFWYKSTYTTTTNTDRYALLRFGTTGYRVSLANNARVSVIVNNLNEPILNTNGDIIGYDTQKTLTTTSGIKNKDWNHVVFTVKEAELGKNTFSLYVNGALKRNENYTITSSSSAGDDFSISFDDRPDIFIDQAAIYDFALTGSQVLDHYSFISSLDPNVSIFSDDFNATSESGNHSFVVTSDAYPEIKEMAASAEIVDPTTIAGTSITNIADAITASSEAIDPSVQYDTTSAAEEMIAYSESIEGFALNSIYADFVNAEIMPYRYVTFDAAEEFLDYGSDNDYAVSPVVVGGTIVSPQFGINGKSALTAGNSYITDGVILKESEWNDDWGTGTARYHSSFWIKKSEEDNSTGLRVIWNLNGHLDNQHVVLYQYQNKLHMQFNNGSGTYIEQATVNNIDLFDGQRHFVLIDFDHKGNNNNKVYLYVDAVLVMTVSLGAYTGSTVNYESFVPANDEQYNQPRLSVGCLITPFASTALPVIPTNTKIYVDEIIWAKTAINQNDVSALYSEMPDQSNSIFLAMAMTASATQIEPELSTEVVFVAEPSTAESDIIEPEIVAVFTISVSALPMESEATSGDHQRSEEIIITTDTGIANATFNDPGVLITIPGGPMTASARLLSRKTFENGTIQQGIKVNGYYIDLVFSPLVRFIRADVQQTIINMSEVE